MADFLSNSMKKIVVESEWLPPIVIDNPLSPAPPGQGVSPVVRSLKPKITIYTSIGSPIVSRPYGEPTQNWPLVRNLGIGLGIFWLGSKLLIGGKRRSRPSVAVAGLGVPPYAAFPRRPPRGMKRRRPRA